MWYMCVFVYKDACKQRLLLSIVIWGLSIRHNESSLLSVLLQQSEPKQTIPKTRIGSTRVSIPTYFASWIYSEEPQIQTDTKSVPTNPATQGNWKLLIRCSGFKGKATGKVEAKSVRLPLARLTWFLSGFTESLVSSEAINWNRLTRPLRWHDSPLIRWTPSRDRPKLCVTYDTKVSLRSSSMRPSEVELELEHDLMQTQERPEADPIHSLKLYNGERSRLPALGYSCAQSVSH